jgi:hypothetical protein
MTTQPPDLKKLREVRDVLLNEATWYAERGTSTYLDYKDIAETIDQAIDAYEASARDADLLRAKVEGFTSVLKRYQDARVFTNLHTRQIARSIADDAELDTARLLDDAARHATQGD